MCRSIKIETEYTNELLIADSSFYLVICYLNMIHTTGFAQAPKHRPNPSAANVNKMYTMVKRV